VSNQTITLVEVNQLVNRPVLRELYAATALPLWVSFSLGLLTRAGNRSGTIHLIVKIIKLFFGLFLDAGSEIFYES